jgi:hypothetical protein
MIKPCIIEIPSASFPLAALKNSLQSIRLSITSNEEKLKL